MTTPRIKRTVVIGLAVLCMASGCSLFRDEAKIQAEKDRIRRKKEHYAALTGAISDGTIRTGLSGEDVREVYGEPDDIFRSGSSMSQVEIWTYEKVMAPGEEDWSPVRLYFDNGKLLTWKY